MDEFRLLRELVYRYCGIVLREELKFVAERKLRPRLEALGRVGFRDYRHHLLYEAGGRAELEAAVEVLTTNETYFWRDPQQLTAFADEVLPELARRNLDTRSLAIWSAGCSSGEELYTVAMLVLESGLFTGWRLELCGTDISRRMLMVAEKAEYGATSVRQTPAAFLEKYFEKLPGERFRVGAAVRSLASFTRLNLVEPLSPQSQRVFDVVFCRNVLIYFDAQARSRALRLLRGRLLPGGLLFLGHAENLLSAGTDFELVHFDGDLAYRSPGGRTERAP